MLSGLDQWEPLPFALLRTPLLPFDMYPSVLRSCDEKREHPMLGDADVRRAIKAASPALDAAIERDCALGRSVDKTRRAVVAMIARMTGRSTPFGLFAGITLASVDAATTLELLSREHHLCTAEPDLGFINDVAGAIERDAALKRILTYTVNTSVLPGANWIRYVEPSVDQTSGVRYQASKIQPTDYLTLILETARHGASWQTLTDALLKYGGGLHAIESLLDELIATGLLVSSARPSITTDVRPDAFPVRRLDPSRLPPNWKRHIGSWDSSRHDGFQDAERVDDIARDQVRSWSSGRKALLCDITLLKPGRSVTIGRALAGELLRGIHILHALGAPADPLAEFRERFVTRFGSQAVPLLTVVDPECGVALTSSAQLTSSLTRGMPNDEVNTAEIRWSTRDEQLMRWVADSHRRQAFELHLEEEQVASLFVQPMGDALKNVPSFCVMASVEAASDHDIDAGRFTAWIDGFSLSVSLLGRFARADAALAEHLKDACRWEAEREPGCILAEIVHEPAGLNTANVVKRGALRDCEIPYLGRSGGAARTIAVDDLFVRVSRQRVTLWSETLQTSVKPCLSVAHAHFASGNAPVYQLLCAIGNQPLSNIPRWEWPAPFRAMPFLPRVRTGRLVLSLARWNLSVDDLGRLVHCADDVAVDRFVDFANEMRMPAFVTLCVGDRRLPVSVQSRTSVAMAVRQLRHMTTATLMEMFPDPSRLCVRSPDGRFVNEVIIPFRNTSYRGSPAADTPSWSIVRRSASSGPSDTSAWVYFKVYVPRHAQDDYLRRRIRPLIEGLEASRDIDRWFFIRYHDDDDHVRFRVLSRERRMRDDVRRLTESALADPIDDDPCWRIQSDVYQRELDRYGGPVGMECAERLFHADSAAVIDLLADPRTAGMPRWVLGLAGIYAVLEDFGFTLDERLSLADAQRAAFFAEMPLTKRRRAWLAGKARSERRHLESIPSLAESVFARRRTAWASAIASLKQQRERVTVPLPSFAASIMHMHLNRLLGVGPRSQEAVLYDLLTCVCERVQRRHTAGAEV